MKKVRIGVVTVVVPLNFHPAAIQDSKAALACAIDNDRASTTWVRFER